MGHPATIRAMTAADVVSAATCRHTYRARRMELGPPAAWRPEMLWGQFNMAVG